MDESLEARRRRALFRSHRRGTKESDLVIGGFADRHVPVMDADQLARFEALLDRNDPEVLGWVIGLHPVPPEFDHDVMNLLKHFKSEL